MWKKGNLKVKEDIIVNMKFLPPPPKKKKKEEENLVLILMTSMFLPVSKFLFLVTS